MLGTAAAGRESSVSSHHTTSRWAMRASTFHQQPPAPAALNASQQHQQSAAPALPTQRLSSVSVAGRVASTPAPATAHPPAPALQRSATLSRGWSTRLDGRSALYVTHTAQGEEEVAVPEALVRTAPISPAHALALPPPQVTAPVAIHPLAEAAALGV